ncbi:MAG: helix-turn-helix domain-containing protein [Terriglobia bacterium]
MAISEVSRVVRKVRQRLGLSQEGLSRRLNATKGAVQHWERGRNQPELARLFLLRRLCPPGAERKDVEGLIRQAQSKVAGVAEGGRTAVAHRAGVESGSQMLARENTRLRQQIAKLQTANERRAEQLRILEDLAAHLQRQVAELKAEKISPEDSAKTFSPASAQ